MSRFHGQQFAKPENALKRAEELVAVGQKSAALQALHDVITSKRHRTWQKTLEKIMCKYVELCVDLRKGRMAKEGLIPFRIICQQVNVSSLEEVIKYFLKLATERADAARSQAEALLANVEDLDELASPEDIMLSYVSADKDKDRTDRELVTPWFKFLWETYRSVLEILRNNNKLEALYAMTANRAFQFCLQYKRTTEFRRLCEILRNHLTNLNNKYRDGRDRPDLTLPETYQLYLETRFEQLKVAVELELWQEAFRSIEDIHGLITLVKKQPKTQLMAVYYAKLTKVFWKSDNKLYCAYAWYKLYNLSKTYNKNLSASDLKLMASAVLLATMSVSPYERKSISHHYELELEKERMLRTASLLGFTSSGQKKDSSAIVLSRAALMAELHAKGVVALALPEVQSIYDCLEVEFHPLNLCDMAKPLIEKLGQGIAEEPSSAFPVPDVDLSLFMPPLAKLTTLRMIQQLSTVYSNFKIDFLEERVKPFNKNFNDVERMIVDAVKYGYLRVTLEHKSGLVKCGAPQLESDLMKNHISSLTQRLTTAVNMIKPGKTEVGEKSKEAVEELLRSVDVEHKRVLARKVIIERRKEEQEQRLLEQEREEEKKRQQQEKLTLEAEQKRLAQEQAKREMDRVRAELEERELEEARQLLAEREKMKGKKGKKVDGDVKLDKNQIMADNLSEQLKIRQEMERKLQKLIKTMDHFERARREEERPLHEEASKNRMEEESAYFQAEVKRQAEAHRAQWEAELLEKKRYTKMQIDLEKLKSEVTERRAEEFARRNAEREERISELRAIAHAQLIEKRKIAYARRLHEEAIRTAIEEEQARIAAEEERKRAEREAARKEAEEAARRQREREEEVERKEMERRAAEQRQREEERKSRFSSSNNEDRWGRGRSDPDSRPSERQNADGAEEEGNDSSARWEPSRRRRDERNPRDERPRGDEGWSRGSNRRDDDRPRDDRPRDDRPRDEDRWGGRRGGDSGRDFGRRDDGRDFGRRDDREDRGGRGGFGERRDDRGGRGGYGERRDDRRYERRDDRPRDSGSRW